ncbi:MAG TPA: hypothetical protein VFQ63_04105 [Patescibacteria group bacterium]|nr:hypothetical protein [Patescibacteria group bacterium]
MEFAPRSSDVMKNPERGLARGVIRETTFDKAKDTRLPDFLRLSPHTGVQFRPTEKVVYRKVFGEGVVAVPLWTGEMVSWETDEQLENNEFTPVSISPKKKRRGGSSGENIIPSGFYFTGSENGWYATDMTSTQDTQVFIVGVEIVARKDDPDGAALISLAHEMGHLEIMRREDDRLLAQAAEATDSSLLPKRAKIVSYASHMIDALSRSFSADFSSRRAMFDTMRNSRAVDSSMRLFHERHAWADGFGRLRRSPFIRHEMFLLGTESLSDFAKRCLETYAHARNERRFTHGFRNG